MWRQGASLGKISFSYQDDNQLRLAETESVRAEAAYRRGDALEKRRTMMEAWAAWCEPKHENVLAFSRPSERKSREIAGVLPGQRKSGHRWIPQVIVLAVGRLNPQNRRSRSDQGGGPGLAFSRIPIVLR
jgi:hypothetical protein